jgi:exonuclease 3'-5' domain-containing protein 2
MTRPLSKQLYDNILAITPEGDPLCRCNQKKANWYIQRDLAEVVSENPTIIRLKFKPKGVGHIGDDFYLAERVNVCVVCGTDEEQTRHHIVPYCFRRYFPEKVKQHNSHDIVPLCVKCHDEYEKQADKLKVALGHKYGVKYGENVVLDPLKVRVRRHATALMVYRDRIPPARLGLLMASVKDYYGEDEITDKDINAAANLDPTIKDNGDKKKYGELIVSRVKDLEEFVKMWRKHFLTSMSPKHMPSHWTVERKLVNNV